jgi:hypothetical protein
MTTRTLQFYGQGYGTTPATITATLDGVTIYTGAVPTIDAPYTYDYPDQPLLFEGGSIPADFSGTIPMTVEVTNGVVIFIWIYANYCPVQNPVFTTEQWAIVSSTTLPWADKLTVYEAVATPPFTTEEIAILESTDPATFPAKNQILVDHNASNYLLTADNWGDTFPGDNRTNVTIDGIPQSAPDPRPPGKDGDWPWVVSAGSVLAYDFNINAVDSNSI